MPYNTKMAFSKWVRGLLLFPPGLSKGCRWVFTGGVCRGSAPQGLVGKGSSTGGLPGPPGGPHGGGSLCYNNTSACTPTHLPTRPAAIPSTFHPHLHLL